MFKGAGGFSVAVSVPQIKKGALMTNQEAVKVLKELKTYCSADALDAVHYAIAIIEHLEKAGVTKPLEADLSKAAN